MKEHNQILIALMISLMFMLVLPIALSAPTAFNCTDFHGTSSNDTTGVDFSPIFNWSITTATNFSHYYLMIRNGSKTAGDTFIQVNITTNTTLFYEPTLTANDNEIYNFYIKAYDEQGGVTNATECGDASNLYVYTTDTTCSALSTGWNTCGALVAARKNMSEMCSEVNCDYMSRLNASNHVWVTYTNGSATNAGETYQIGEAIWINVASAQTWDNTDVTDSKDGRYWGATTMVETGSTYFTNGTGGTVEWNIRCVTNQSHSLFEDIQTIMSTRANGTWSSPENNSLDSIPWYSYVNQSGGNNVPALLDWTIGDGVTVDYGECVWAHLNDAAIGWVNFTI